MIRVLLADDQSLVRGALAALLSLEPDLEVVAEVGRGDEVVAAARESKPDVALLDVEMPGLDGIAAAAALRAEVPAGRVVILTTFGRPGYLRRAMEAGALGFVVKDAPAERAGRGGPPGRRRAAGGRPDAGRGHPGRRLQPADRPRAGRPLAARDGGTVADIAGRLFLSEGTVRNYLSAAITKTNTRNRVEALRTAEANGWLYPPDFEIFRNPCGRIASVMCVTYASFCRPGEASGWAVRPIDIRKFRNSRVPLRPGPACRHATSRRPTI